jgi:signal transduction histidine kinase
MAVATGDLDELLSVIVETTVEVVGADRATLYLREGDELVSRVKVGADLETITVPIGHGIAGHAAKTKKLVSVANAHRDARFDPSWDDKSGYRTRSIVAAPILSDDGEPIGVLQALNKIGADGESKPFTRYDRELLRALAAQAAVSIDKARLFEKMRSTTERLERTLANLELLYQLETAMSSADTVGELAAKVVAEVGRACDAEAGALLHRTQQGELALYAVNLAAPEELRQMLVEADAGAAFSAVSNGKLVSLGASQVRESRRMRELLDIDVRSAIAAPLGPDDKPVGALAFYNRRTRAAFGDDDAALVKLVSANVSTELRVIDARQARERDGRLETIGRLLSGVMHDLRTPLAVIGGYVQMMEASHDGEKRAGYGKIIAEQFELIATMQRDLLAYARGERPLLERKIDVGRFFDELRGQFAADAEMLGVSIRVDVENSLAWFDEPKMARVMHNLMRNALEAMQSTGGELALSARVAHEGLEMVVSDTGGGIPRAIQNRLFEPFVTAGKRHGTGLGLANVKKIVEEHQGSVQVRSSPRGTCFTVVLPRAIDRR